MLTVTEIAGFAGVGLAGAAYVPQISHLIRARCSAGISRLAFVVWLLAALLTTARAVAIHAGVFIALGGIQIVATALVMLYATRYKNSPCPVHLPRQPTATAATGTGTPGNEPGSWHPAGRPALRTAGTQSSRAVRDPLSAPDVLPAARHELRRALRERCGSYLQPCNESETTRRGVR